MISNYFIIAWRNIWSNKVLSAIKIIGLTLGLMVCMFILLYTKDEKSFDQFHQKKASIFRVTQTMEVGHDLPNKMGFTQPPLGPAFKEETPEIAQFVRVDGTQATIKSGNEVYLEHPLAADSNFFRVFSFSLLKGNPATALNDPHSAVLSEESAIKYFGTRDVLGKILEIKKEDVFEHYTVTGLVENAPQNSSIQYRIILPFTYSNQQPGWIGGGPNTFLLLQPSASEPVVTKKIQAIFDRHTKEQIDGAKKEQNLTVKIALGLQPLTDIHLNTSFGAYNGLENGSDPVYSNILSAIAFFILIIACINFVNLALGQSLKRSKEIGIRKVIGGTRRQLMVQFMVESFVISLIAFMLAGILVVTLLPLFNQLAEKKLNFSYLSGFGLYIGFLMLLIITALVAGFYPSLVLSRFKPVKVLYGKGKLLGKNYFTRSLVVLQFALAIFLMIGTIVIYSQLNFFLHKDLGYSSTNLVRIDMPFSKDNNQLLQRFKNELKDQPSLLHIAGRNRGTAITGAKADGHEILIDLNRIDEAFFPAFEIPFVAGRNFSTDFAADSAKSVIVNEQFVAEAGWTNEKAVGKNVLFGDDQQQRMIVGVIRNYHFRPLKEKIKAQLFTTTDREPFGQIWVKINPENLTGNLSLLRNTYRKLSPFYPYSYQFIDEINAKNYEKETKWKQIISISSILFMAISCMGLFGLVILSVEQRTKEIGIRKVLGAASNKIVLLISKDFIQLIGLSFLLAMPLGYWAVYQWLQHFAYRINLKWWMFVGAGVSVMILALATIGWKSIRAAMANPVDSLRAE